MATCALSGLRHKYDDVRCAQFGLWRGARRAHPLPWGCNRRATKPQAKFGATRRAAGLFAQTSLLAPHRSTAGYARRSRLVWAKNPLPRTSSYLCLRPLRRRAPDKTRGRGRPRPTLELNAGVEGAPLTSLPVRWSLSAAQVQAYESKLTRMNTTLSFTIAAAGLLLSLTSGSGQTPAKPTNSVSLGQSHFVAFGTNKIHYVTAGKGNHTIMFVHCWAGNSGFWREQVPALADTARLVLIDLPGHGRSDKPHTNYTMDFFASAVLTVMRDAQVDKATLVGHSMGTPVICRVYKQAPAKVAALVAIDGILRRPKMPAEQAYKFVAAFCAPEYRENTR